MLTLADVFQALTKDRPAEADKIAIADVCVDSRQVNAGALFVALKGEAHDGHEFIHDALARGAAAVIAEERAESSGLGPSVRVVKTSTGVAGLQPGPESLVPTIFLAPSSLKALQKLAAFWRRRFSNCKAIGITGSIGKSSTKELIASVLQRRYRVLKSKGNLNNEIGLPLTLLQMDETHERAVVEMGMYALGEICELCQIAQPTIGVVTNVGPSHLERLGTMERIAEAKSELVEALPADGVAILNRDDPRVRAMRTKTSARVFYYGLDPHSDLWADEIESYGLEGIAFDLRYGREKIHTRMPLLGRHSVHTALAAASVGVVEGLSWDEILSGLKDEAAQLRLIAVPAENGTTILDDTYNANPESSLAALNLLAELNGRKVAVLGDMLELGPIEEEGHRVIGGRAAEVVEVLVAVGAKGKWIGQAARDAGLSPNTFFAENNARAIEILRGVLQPGDMVLVKGSRGAKMEEIVAALARENGEPEPH
ncbi:MAG: UDP-N-acetylmuramoyl-tripeptide--D-alanyl-D-alanine ligase [Chloroflexi bacterium]|nr:UDP-N-acetylmuramoyl-tripeptide--D-alanyl-D-alanine ligase [Chloroflexota bacterium]